MIPLLFDISQINLNDAVVDRAGLEILNRQRGEAMQLDRIVWLSEDWTRAVAVKRIRSDEWWVPGHIPGRPLFPAVMMIEAAAQLASYMFLAREARDYNFVGFTGIDNTKFRSTVEPGDDLILIAQQHKYHVRRFVCDIQGIACDRRIFDTRITGMPI